MRNIGALIKNELIKQLKKTSVKVMIILIVISSIALPFALNVIENKENDKKWYLENYKNELQAYKDIDDNSDKTLNKSFNSLHIEKLEMLIDNDISYNDWRYASTDEWEYKSMEAIAIQAIIDGYDKDTIKNAGYYGAFVKSQDQESQEYFSMSKEELKTELSKIEESRNHIKDSIIKNDYLEYVKSAIDSLSNNLSTMNKSLSELKKSEANDKDGVIKHQISSLEAEIYGEEERLKATQYRYDNKIDYDVKDWRSKTISSIGNMSNNLKETLMTEEEFKKNYRDKISDTFTYETYKDNFEKSKIETEQEIALNWYSLENDIGQVKFCNDSRKFVDRVYLIYISVVIILSIIISGGIVSSEHSTGTIRLLLIRPVSRWKFLLSKLLAVLIISYGVLFISFIGIILSSGIVKGFYGYGISTLVYTAAGIVEKNYILSIIPKLLFSSISIIFITCIAFTISTIIKNTALAVGITTMFFFGSQAAVILLLSFNMKWVVNTVLPYVNLSSFSDRSLVIQEQYNIVLNPSMGAIHLLIVSLILIIISFIVFVKRDVK